LTPSSTYHSCYHPTAPTANYTLSLHDALPIFEHDPHEIWASQIGVAVEALGRAQVGPKEVAAIGITNQRETTIIWDRETGEPIRSEEHTSELQSRFDLVCRLLLEKKKGHNVGA